NRRPMRRRTTARDRRRGGDALRRAGATAGREERHRSRSTRASDTRQEERPPPGPPLASKGAWASVLRAQARVIVARRSLSVAPGRIDHRAALSKLEPAAAPHGLTLIRHVGARRLGQLLVEGRAVTQAAARSSSICKTPSSIPFHSSRLLSTNLS